jgi:hypothetical protein
VKDGKINSTDILTELQLSPMTRIAAFTILLFLSSCGRTHLLKETKRIEHFPSASAIEFNNDRLFVTGDDASYMLVLYNNLATIDSIALYGFSSKRIDKATKPDLESVGIFGWRAARRLLLLGSGSLSPYRDVGWIIDPQTKKTDSIRLDTIYQRLRLQGIKEINIEGSCAIPGGYLLSNRGHLGYRRNYLLLTDATFWTKQESASISTVLIGGNADTSSFNGVSGLAYAAKSDRLVMSVSTEATTSVYEDGVIGKSYLWIVKNISSKKRWKSLNADQVIDLEDIDPVFKGQKIESVCVMKETRHFLHLVLAADNDDGSSTLFKVLVEKK